MSFTRISDNLFDSSLWSDSSYEGVCTLKLWLAILGEARTAAGRFRRLTPAKAARIGAIPLEMAATAIEKLTSPDPMDSSGFADGRRLLPDADGAPNDYIVANWETYGREFERASKAARQRRWRAKRAAFEVDASVYAASTGRRDVDGGEAQEEKKRSRKEKPVTSEVASDVRTPKDPRFAEDSVEYELAALLFTLIQKRRPAIRRPDLQKWAQQIDLMIRRDGRDAAEIRRVIEWCQSDDVPDARTRFCWANTILSTSNLREHFDRVALRAQKPPLRVMRDEHEECIGRATF